MGGHHSATRAFALTLASGALLTGCSSLVAQPAITAAEPDVTVTIAAQPTASLSAISPPSSTVPTPVPPAPASLTGPAATVKAPAGTTSTVATPAPVVTRIVTIAPLPAVTTQVVVQTQAAPPPAAQVQVSSQPPNPSSRGTSAAARTVNEALAALPADVLGRPLLNQPRAQGGSARKYWIAYYGTPGYLTINITMRDPADAIVGWESNRRSVGAEMAVVQGVECATQAETHECVAPLTDGSLMVTSKIDIESVAAVAKSVANRPG